MEGGREAEHASTISIRSRLYIHDVWVYCLSVAGTVPVLFVYVFGVIVPCGEPI